MSAHDPIRKDKTCLNCRHVVEERFCTHCGQENTNTRKTFHHLFVHFFEDLTHYENAFWKTIRHLLTRPGRLTREYLSGKRLSYLAPIRLYIFISFVTFFLITVVPDAESEDDDSVAHNEDTRGAQPDPMKDESKEFSEKVTDSVYKEQEIAFRSMVKQGFMTQPQADSILKKMKNGSHDFSTSDIFNVRFKTVAQLDSAQKFSKPADRLDDTEYWIYKRYIQVTSKNSKEELMEKYKEAFMHNLPKVLFIYMPIFAFFLWLFNDKKKWFYFEHGIFTLHYFSFLLLMILIITMISTLCTYLRGLGEVLDPLLCIPLFLWFLYYFFRPITDFTKTHAWYLSLKSMALLFFNTIIVSLLMLLYAGYTLLNLH